MAAPMWVSLLGVLPREVEIPAPWTGDGTVLQIKLAGEGKDGYRGYLVPLSDAPMKLELGSPVEPYDTRKCS